MTTAARVSATLRLMVSYAASGGLCLAVACGGGSTSGDGSGDGASSGSSGGSSGGSGSSSGSSGSSGGSGSSSGSSSGGSGSSSGSSSGGSGSSSGSSSSSGGSSGGHGDAGDEGHGDDGGTEDGGGLNANVSPGGNFDLSVWELQEPVGSPGSPTTILPAKLVGPSGYHDTYFFTDPTDGSMSFWDPENGVTTANSDYPRSELREMTASGAAANWMSTGTNTMSATVKATMIPDHVAVGQIHLGTGTPSSTKPLLELFYYATGAIVMAIEQTPAGGNEVPNPVGNVPLGTAWSYVIGLSGNTITCIINGGATQTFSMSSTFNDEGMYFKAGDYDQSVGTSATVGAKVQFYALSIFHGP
jgi:Alginate lyase